ncbi:TnsA-like heteromeric transposase endonuclease subunit [Cryobacterium sp. 10I5]|uniref:TnsA-like heteromeric transposase endonuclease subunit n=1 Tax=Cryobacterium sp. 10I5 TaxID=3048581 RepID=UPI002B22E17D|nr:TnsA-like heteromeric transposase endonuclease subunit [Cryobacterium sp. 10I5]MEB0266808.1 TnsA-like heteromeric transposase endonuclease subunit [Cryobacterium sp. 10I5]
MSGALVANAQLTQAPGTDAPDVILSSTIRWFDSQKKKHAARPTPALLHEHFDTNTASRVGAKYPGRRNFHGSYWFSGTAQHVKFESGFEQTALMVLDFDGDVAGVAAQPFLIDFGSKQTPSTHVPDFFFVRRDGTQSVLDVRPDIRVDERAKASFLATREVCEGIGWNYDVFAWIEPTYLKNIQWLARYRHPRNAPPVEFELRLLDYCAQPRRISDLAAAFPQCNPARVLVWSYHLLWRRALTVDMRAPLSPQHLIQAVQYA